MYLKLPVHSQQLNLWHLQNMIFNSVETQLERKNTLTLLAHITVIYQSHSLGPQTKPWPSQPTAPAPRVISKALRKCMKVPMRRARGPISFRQMWTLTLLSLC